jgi:hypothetical protein
MGDEVVLPVQVQRDEDEDWREEYSLGKGHASSDYID